MSAHDPRLGGTAPRGWPIADWPPATIVLATANPGKTAELTALLEGITHVEPRPASVPDVDETEASLEGNARLKARAIADATGMIALADDTGLEVDGLDGRPGVHSARYAGPDGDAAANMTLLLTELAPTPLTSGDGDVAAPSRRARFRTVLVLAHPGGAELVTTGVVEGSIGHEPVGDDGFGYDPVFIPDDGDGRTFAQMTRDEKQAISHRGRALTALAETIR